MERAVILCEDDTITSCDLNLNLHHPFHEEETLTLEEMEKRMIAMELKKNSQSLSLAARNLGISRTTLYTKIKKYGI